MPRTMDPMYPLPLAEAKDLLERDLLDQPQAVTPSPIPN
jgi:hypothetical protein